MLMSVRRGPLRLMFLPGISASRSRCRPARRSRRRSARPCAPRNENDPNNAGPTAEPTAPRMREAMMFRFSIVVIPGEQRSALRGKGTQDFESRMRKLGFPSLASRASARSSPGMTSVVGVTSAGERCSLPDYSLSPTHVGERAGVRGRCNRLRLTQICAGGIQMPYIASTITLIVVCGLLSAVLALPLRFLFRWPWIWAFVAGTALIAATELFPNDTWGPFGRLTVNRSWPLISVVMLRQKRGWHWPKAVAAGTALFIALSILNLPIETHAVRVDMPSSR